MEDDDYHIDEDFLRKFTEQYGDAEHPLFMEEIPHDFAGNEDFEALQQLLAEGETRESIAEKYKEVGNGYVQEGAFYYDAAISSYTKGIEAASKDEKLNSLLYLNRAFVYLKRKEYVKCVDDCRNSIKRDPTNMKAYYRAAVASYELGLYKKVISFCMDFYDQKKREEKEHNKDLLDTLAAASADFANVYKRTMDMLRKRDEILRDMKQTENAAKMELLKETKDVIEMLNNNGITLSKSLYEIPAIHNIVCYHENGCLHTSCLLIYDEYNITDYIENFDYSTTIGDHLDVMFQDANDEKSFTRHNCRCLYEISKGEFFEFGTHETMATVIFKTKIAYKVAPVHIVHKHFQVQTLSN